MPSWSLAAPDARAHQSFMLLTGAVLVASAIAQAATLSTPAFDNAPAPSSAPAIVAPAPTLTPIDTPPEAGFTFRAPTPGYPINSPFGLRRLPWEPRGRMHEGVDIAAPEGLPVGVTLPGVVIRTGQGGAYGRFVEVRHAEGLTSLYAHLGSVRRGLTAGTPLSAGERVGLVGNTGRSTGEHLHFEIRAEGRPLNPALFIDKAFATADDLPLDAAARFSRRVRQAVVSPETLARMMPKVGLAPEKVKAGRGERPRAVLVAAVPAGDPSPQAFAAAAAARDASAREPVAEPAVQAAPVVAPAALSDAAPTLPTATRPLGPPPMDLRG